jgi:hypothetical protein
MDDYSDIKNNNIRKYGTDIGRVGALLLANLYSDRSHFIYELLQNAEDACERLRATENVGNFSVSFELYPDRLEFRHNGISFNKRDVGGICGINEDIKSEYERQIGKFGIGFKSVFAYTQCPEIYSGEKTFCIKNYVWPEAIPLRHDVNSDETLIVIPFHKINLPFLQNEVTPEIAFDEIKKKLLNLSLRTLLFTNNISEIKWQVDEEKGSYIRTQKRENELRWVNLVSEGKEKEEWIVFGKAIEIEGKQAKIETAYKTLSKEDGQKKILKATDTKLTVYFSTQKETKLNFLIQGPYNTTPTREDIRKNDSWNQGLIMETAVMVGESITLMKRIGLLDTNFLSILPLSPELFEQETNSFHPIFQEVKKVLSSDLKLLPTSTGGFSSAKDALLGGSKELIRLLSSEQLEALFEKKNWVDDKVTERGEYQYFWTYLKDEIEIKEIEPTHFAIKLNKLFLEKQSNEWIINFYKYLQKPKYLWEEKEVTLRAPGEWGRYESLRVKEIIRLENGTHICPFDNNGNPKAFLPPSDSYIQKNISGFFKNRIKASIIKNEEAMKFLKMLGLREPDAISAVNDYILPKYRGPYNNEWEVGEEEDELIKVNLKTNFQDAERIFKALSKFPHDPRKEKLINDLLETKFLYCRNMKDGRKYYCSSEDNIYLGKKYTGNEDIEIFFEGNDDIWVLDDIYENKIDVKTLKIFGCKSEIKVSYREPRWGRHVIIMDRHSNHKRGLNGFDPDYVIEGLEWALENVTIEKSIIIWGLLKRHYKQIKGTVETATRQDYSNANRKNHYSTMGEMLIDKPWLYKEGNITTPQLPSEMLLENLSSDYECPEGQMIADQLGFVTPVTKELKEKMDPTDRKLYEAFEEVKRLGKGDDFLELLKKWREAEYIKSVEKDPSDIASDLEELLTTPMVEPEEDETNESGVIIGLTPDEGEEIQKVHGEEIPKILEKIKLKTEVKSSVESKSIGSIDMGQFLIAEYDGHCQICNVRLFSGNKKNKRGGLEFMTTRLIETRNKRPYTNMEWNVLCLCPNHFALFKWGSKELKNIWEIANKVLIGEIAAEWVEERKGDYYITKIKMMMENGNLEETELYYSPTHMRKVVALLSR